ncbi:GntR family transcriptional regulator [Saccharopolyspora sp. 5N708]|uniref:GntR family transcriptional regulator n=1 Tax=Saccharopolyspora sp. 5N708 TaxID=3457424 RepID=UPI003FD3F1FC
MSGQVRLKHQLIAAELAADIRAGRLRHGERLPGEHALATRFAVSRNTVRLALSELGDQGLIATHSGKGSFVDFDGRSLDDRAGWSHALAAQGVRTEVCVVRLDLVQDAELAERIGVDDDEFVAVDRVRKLVDGAPISFERSRVPAIGELRRLPEIGLGQRSLFEVLRSVGLVVERGEQWAALHQLLPEEARMLDRAPGSSVLRTRRLGRTHAGEFVEHVDSLLDPDRFQLHQSFGGDR